MVSNKEVLVTPLFADPYEHVSLLTMSAHQSIYLSCQGRAERLVLQGQLFEQEDILTKHSWLRSLMGFAIQTNAGPLGAMVWVKTGHLCDLEQQIKGVQQA